MGGREKGTGSKPEGCREDRKEIVGLKSKAGEWETLAGGFECLGEKEINRIF